MCIYLYVHVLYTVFVSGSTPKGLRRQQRRGSGSTAHNLSPGNAAMLQAAGKTHIPGEVRDEDRDEELKETQSGS